MKNLAIVGSHPRTRGDVDWNDSNLDIWGFNEVLSNFKKDPEKSFFKRGDGIFQMHLPAIWKNPLNRADTTHYDWLASGDTPEIFMLDNYPEVPKCTKYPMEEICEALLPSLTIDSEVARKTFFTSTAAYAVALGIYRGYKRIDLFGVELEQMEEYQFQRDSTCFWIGVGIGRGVEIVLHSNMLATPIYGLESFITIDKQNFLDNIAAYSPQCDTLQKVYEAAKTKAEALYKEYERRDGVAKELEEAILEQAKAGQMYGLADGARQENQRYLARANAMEEASGHYVFSRHEFERDKNAIKKQRENTILQWAQVGGVCQKLMSQIHKPFDKRRKQLYHELGGMIEEYIKLSVMIGMYTGGAEEDDRLKMLMKKEQDDKTS